MQNRWPARIVSYYARPRSFTTGGVNTSLVAWLSELSQRVGHGLAVWAKDGFCTSVPGTIKIQIPHYGSERMAMVPRPGALSQLLAPGDLVVLHEGWTPSNAAAAAEARQVGAQYVVIPHGVYEPNTVRSQRFTRLRQILERRVLTAALGVHVFFEREASYVRAIAPGSQPFVVPTGMRPHTDLAWIGGGGYLGWMGRYDVNVKGLDLLVKAVAAVPATSRPVVHLHGPDHRGGKQRLAELVAAHGLREWITIGSELHGDDRWQFYQRAEAVVHPSRWDSFGHALVEAVQMGVPTIVNSSIEIADTLGRAGAATVVHGDIAAWAAALATDDARERARISDNARRWAGQALDWDPIVTAWLDQVRHLNETWASRVVTR